MLGSARGLHAYAPGGVSMAAERVEAPSTATRPAVKRLVKLGGAAITKKAQFETLDGEVLRVVCQQLAAGCQPAGQADTIIVHGAGSFGHFQASEYGVSKGPIHDARVRQGFALTRSAPSANYLTTAPANC